MSKRPSLADVTRYFYKGNFKEVLDYFGRTLPPQKTSNFEELAFLQLGSLVFRGEFNEAKLNYQKALTLGNRTSLFLARCRFYLGVGCVRRSFYAEATTYFSQNLSSVRNSKSSKEEIFYAKQGAAFFHFYKGN